MSRYLVTTADPRGWPGPEDDAVALWRVCRPSPGTGALAAPFYPDVARRIELAAEERRLYATLLPGVAEGLNRYHGTDFDVRQWEIMAGPFLRRYIRVVMNRFLKLELVIREDGIERSIILRHDRETAPRDTLHFINLTEDDGWNHSVCSWFLTDFFPAVEIEERPVQAEADASGPARQSPPEPESPLRRTVRRLLEALRMAQPVFIQDMHASRPLKLSFYVRNRQVPLRPRFFDPDALRRPADRNGLCFGTLIPEKRHGYEAALERYLPRLLPKNLVEAFEDYVREARAGSEGESQERVIVTSTSFDADERFKVWVADQIGRGARYVVLQHGAVYGVSPFFEDTVEERTADRFITWGWSRGPRHVPGFCLTTPGRGIHRRRDADGLLLVTMGQRRKKFIWDVEAEFDAYMDAQYEFVDALSPDLREKLTIRLYPAHARMLGGEKELFETRYPGVSIDPGVGDFWDALAHFRLAVFTYDSTGFLELLRIGFPVVAYWNEDGFDQVSPTARREYDRLVEAGLLYHTPSALARFLSDHWHRLDEWWNSPSVRGARESFCAEYAAAPEGGARRLRELVLGGATAAPARPDGGPR